MSNTVWSTKALVEELSKREGVKHLWVDVEGAYDIKIANDTNIYRITKEGPARILVVID